MEKLVRTPMGHLQMENKIDRKPTHHLQMEIFTFVHFLCCHANLHLGLRPLIMLMRESSWLVLSLLRMGENCSTFTLMS